MKSLGELLRFAGMIGCCVLVFAPDHSYVARGLFLSGIVSWLAAR
jgi:hypothetical protein